MLACWTWRRSNWGCSMHNRFEELHARCRKRRLKSAMKWGGGLLVTALLVGTGIFYYLRTAGEPVSAPISSTGHVPPPTQDSKSAPKPERTTERTVTPVKKVPAATPSKPKVSTPEKSNPAASAPKEINNPPAAPESVRHRERAKKPTMERAKKPAVSGQPGQAKPPKRVASSRKPAEKEKPKRAIVKKAPPPKTTEKKELVESRNRPVLEIKEVQDLDTLIRQYEKYPRYGTAMKIASIYYERSDYENAALWARKANLIDRDNEEAWILYAKSEYALGHRERAKRILRLYLDYRDSVKARTLLLSWRKNDEEEKGKR